MVHWNAYSIFVEKAYKCNDDEEFCASLYDRHTDNWLLRTIPLDKKCYSVAELRSRINCSMNTFREGCFMDPRYNSYQRSIFLLPVCICKGDYCNTQEKIENVWLQQNIYKFHSPEDCRAQLDKQMLTTESVILPETETTIKVTGTSQEITTTEMSTTSQEAATIVGNIMELGQEVIMSSTEINQKTTTATPEVLTLSQETTISISDLNVQAILNITDVSGLEQDKNMTSTEVS